jgi:hypothetical protein
MTGARLRRLRDPADLGPNLPFVRPGLVGGFRGALPASEQGEVEGLAADGGLDSGAGSGAVGRSDAEGLVAVGLEV